MLNQSSLRKKGGNHILWLPPFCIVVSCIIVQSKRLISCESWNWNFYAFSFYWSRTWRLSAIYNSNAREPNILLWPPGAHLHAYSCTDTTHRHNIHHTYHILHTYVPCIPHTPHIYAADIHHIYAAVSTPAETGTTRTPRRAHAAASLLVAFSPTALFPSSFFYSFLQLYLQQPLHLGKGSNNNNNLLILTKTDLI